MLPSYPPLPSPLLLLSTGQYGVKYPWGQLASAVLDMFPPSSSCTPNLLLSLGKSEEQSSSWCCASAAQQWLKHWCVITIVLVRNPNHSIGQATKKKTNSSPSNQHNWEDVVIRGRLYPVALQHQGCCSSLPLGPTHCNAEQVLSVDTNMKYMYTTRVHRLRDRHSTHKHH